MRLVVCLGGPLTQLLAGRHIPQRPVDDQLPRGVALPADVLVRRVVEHGAQAEDDGLSGLCSAPGVFGGPVAAWRVSARGL